MHFNIAVTTLHGQPSFTFADAAAAAATFSPPPFHADDTDCRFSADNSSRNDIASWASYVTLGYYRTVCILQLQSHQDCTTRHDEGFCSSLLPSAIFF